MSTTNTPPDDDSPHLKPKKQKVIQPLSEQNKATPQLSVPEIPGASADLLAELREKTAKLAEQVHGKDEQTKKVLKIDEASDDEVIEALKQDRPDTPFVDAEAGQAEGANQALEMIRGKLARLYKKEPDAAEEAIESYQAGGHRSKHQQFMYELTTSGRPLAEIQKEWHSYYLSLDDDEKHQVWREFYETQSQSAYYTPEDSKPAHKSKHQPKSTPSVKSPRTRSKKTPDTRTVAELKEQLMDKVSAGGRLNAVHHTKSLLFGLGLAAFVGLVITFTFFNEVFIAPFISPSRSVSATPIIGSVDGKVGKDPKIIIPKINLEVPVVFDMNTISEASVQKSLEDGVVHYASTPNPGEKGNAVIVGHSSNNILNSGKYKFAFVLLKRLESEDTFFIQKDGIRYTYKVYKKDIVSPNNVDVLNTQDKPNTVTLITCDPPGTSLNRLVVVAEQISPNPAKNRSSTALNLDDAEVTQLPSNAPSLWSRIWPF